MKSIPTIYGPVYLLIKLGAMVFILSFVWGIQAIMADSHAESCNDGIALQDFPDNPFLAEDCDILLSIRDELSGDGLGLA